MTLPKEFVTKQHRVQALQFTGGVLSAEECSQFLEDAGPNFACEWFQTRDVKEKGEVIDTIEEHIDVFNKEKPAGKIYVNWWLIKDDKGGFTACAPETFEELFDAIRESSNRFEGVDILAVHRVDGLLDHLVIDTPDGPIRVKPYAKTDADALAELKVD